MYYLHQLKKYFLNRSIQNNISFNFENRSTGLDQLVLVWKHHQVFFGYLNPDKIYILKTNNIRVTLPMFWLKKNHCVVHFPCPLVNVAWCHVHSVTAHFSSWQQGSTSSCSLNVYMIDLHIRKQTCSFPKWCPMVHPKVALVAPCSYAHIVIQSR